MVEMYEESAEGIQFIHAVPSGQYNQLLPTVFFYHGFTSSKEIYSHFGYTLAKAGFRVITPDAPMHGARLEPDEAVLLANFWNILQGNVDELASLKDLFVSRGLADPQRLGVGGVSMGGMTTMAALVRFPWVKVAANLMGSGYFSSLSGHLFPAFGEHTALSREQTDRKITRLLEWDVSDHLSLVGSKPLLVWHGEQDDVVPFDESWRLKQALEQQGLAENLTFLSEAGTKHKVSAKAVWQTTDFFKNHL